MTAMTDGPASGGRAADGPAASNPRLAPVIRLAPAKLNLTLAVLGRRPDAYHDLHSVMAPLDLADRLSVAPAAGPEDTLRVVRGATGPIADNLVVRAIAAARAAVGRNVDAVPLAARLEKHIPVAAGLAGGSSDAAAALDAALSAWGADVAYEAAALGELRTRIALSLGSDVPFFLAGGAALVTGRGEMVDPLPGLRGTPPGVLLVTPDVRVSTPAAFAALDVEAAAAPTDARSTRASSEHLALEWRAGLGADALLVRAGIFASANDLANAADFLVPGLRALRRALVRRLGRPVGLSGSGPTLWVLYASTTEAAVAAAAVRAGLGDGTIVAPGTGEPSIIATAIAAAGARPAREPGQEVLT
jgi:4-diphosphocytidyl-2-C-methyl-D-erythritol kinase